MESERFWVTNTTHVCYINNLQVLFIKIWIPESWNRFLSLLVRMIICKEQGFVKGEGLCLFCDCFLQHLDSRQKCRQTSIKEQEGCACSSWGATFWVISKNHVATPTQSSICHHLTLRWALEPPKNGPH